MATIVSPRLVRFFLAVVIWIAATEFAESQIHVGSGSGDQVSGFMCEGGEVIYDHFQCDGILDCYDGSDEQNCPIKCPLQFRCHDNSQCIPKKAVCNKKIDCPDSSDEQYCNLFNYTVHPNQELVCLEHQMRCEDNTICIWESFWCDDETDCVDNSDEQNCDQYHSRFRVGAKCSSSQFQCSSGTCIPRLYLCDGQKDCHDDQVAADEAVCDGDDVVTNCTAGFLDCSNGLCVNVHRRCNGVDDCGNNEDERSCPVGCSGGVHCPVGGVLSCVPEYHKCDGLAECDNLEDEFDCGRVCPDDLFQCSSSITCIDPSRRCDGREDCVDGLDELICALAPPLLACEEDDVPCLDGRHCVETSAVCDGEVDCQDESDEHEYCDPELMMDCDEDNGGCEHICHSVGSHSVGNHSFCSCIHGYVLNTTDFQSCQDVDECSQPGTCRQLCTNTEGSYSCSCAPGYVEAASGYGCRATGPRAFLLFSNRVDIQRVAVRRGRERHLLVKQLTYASDVEYHYKRDLLFWSDQREGVIMMASLSNTSDKSVLINSLKSPSGLAVDWVSDKLYWADSEAGVIEVASLDGRRRKRLISTNIDRPKAIVLDPIARFMFWTDLGSVPKIERASMDGTGRLILHVGYVKHPTALAVDLPSRTIFWADSRLHVIVCSSYDGHNRRPILATGVRHPFSLAVFENKLYWSDWARSAVMSTNIYDSMNMTVVANGRGYYEDDMLLSNVSVVHSDLFYPMGIRVVHPLLQPEFDGEQPCSLSAVKGPGQCEFLCLLSSEVSQGYSCACPPWKEPDGTLCESITGNFLVYSRRVSYVHLVVLGSSEPDDIKLPVDDVGWPVGMDFDPIKNVLYWTDIARDQINSFNLHTLHQKTVIAEGLVTPTAVGVDWLNKKLYWANRDSNGRSTIEVAEFGHSGRRMVLMDWGVVSPSDLVVHSHAGFLFWADSSPPLVGRINLDGSEKVVIAETNLKTPKGLAIDYEFERIYWCDLYNHRIEYANFDGSNRTVLIDGGINPFSLSLYGDWVIWSDKEIGSIDIADKFTGKDQRSFMRVSDIINVKAFSLEQLHGLGGTSYRHTTHPCSHDNGGCGYMCLTRPDPSTGLLQASCRCPGGKTVMADNKTCYSELQQFLLIPRYQQMDQVSLDSTGHVVTPLMIQEFKTASAVSVDTEHDQVYWINAAERVIYRSSLENGSRIAVVSKGLASPGAVAVDSMSGTLYWADSGRHVIEVAMVDGSNRKTVVRGDLTQVNSLALDLQAHIMYWLDAGRYRRPKIEMAAMDGSGRAVLIDRNLGQPFTLAVFHPPGESSKAAIYWTDPRKRVIEKASLEGKNRTTVALLGSEGSHPYGLAVTSEFIYWTDASNRNVYRRPRVGRRQVTVLTQLSISKAVVALAQKDRLWRHDNISMYPCSSNPCSNLCLLSTSPEGFSCHCPNALTTANNAVCRVPRRFIVTSTFQETMYRIILPLPAAGHYSVIRGGPWTPAMFDHILYPSGGGRIFFSDIKRHYICSINFDGTDLTDLLRVGLVESLVVDWINEIMYWIDSIFKTLEVARLDGKAHTTLYRYNSLNGSYLRGLALHPARGILFWTIFGNRPSIIRGRMDGTFVERILELPNGEPNGIAIDYESDTLYWLNFKSHTLESSDMSGNQHRTISGGISTFHGFHLLIRDRIMYWSEWYMNKLYKANLPAPSATTIANVSELLSLDRRYDNRVLGFTLVDLDSPRPQELSKKFQSCAIANGGCLPVHLCLPISVHERKCVCPLGAHHCTEHEGVFGQHVTLPPTDPPTSTSSSLLPMSTSPPEFDNDITVPRTTTLSTSSELTTDANISTTEEVRIRRKNPGVQKSEGSNNNRDLISSSVSLLVAIGTLVVFSILVVIFIIKRKKLRKLIHGGSQMEYESKLDDLSRESSVVHSISSVASHSTPTKKLLSTSNHGSTPQGTSKSAVPARVIDWQLSSNIVPLHDLKPINFSTPVRQLKESTLNQEEDTASGEANSTSHSDGDVSAERLVPPPPPLPPKTYKLEL